VLSWPLQCLGALDTSINYVEFSALLSVLVSWLCAETAFQAGTQLKQSLSYFMMAFGAKRYWSVSAHLM